MRSTICSKPKPRTLEETTTAKATLGKVFGFDAASENPKKFEFIEVTAFITLVIELDMVVVLDLLYVLAARGNQLCSVN